MIVHKIDDISSSKVIQVIEVKFTRGAGTKEDLAREVIQYWSFNGLLLGEYDPVKKFKK
ncbi:carboxypeptidase [Clostridioides difficile]|nr:carboxypeptidase [Clostridioides difficile]EIS9625645.1 carboxypeptidase [Clostridioides difficile]MDO0213553.1 carboxypeptidase [Clostridioides difficile]MDO0345030.1 carboxypeptidase [Clostridioides difficile]